MKPITKGFITAGAGTAALTHLIFIDQIVNQVFGDIAAKTVTLAVIVVGAILLVAGLASMRPTAIVIGLIVIIFAPQIAGFLISIKKGGIDLSSGENNGNSGDESWNKPPPKPIYTPREIPETTRLHGSGESKRKPMSPLGMFIMIGYKNVSEWRFVPELNAVIPTESTLLDMDVTGGPRPIDRIYIYLKVLDDNLDVDQVHIDHITISIGDVEAFKLENKDIKLSWSTKYIKEFPVGYIDGDKLAEYVTSNNTVLKIVGVGSVPTFPLSTNWGAELTFKVGYRSKKVNKIYPTNPEEYYGSILLSSIAVDQDTGINLEQILGIMQLLFYAAAIYTTLRRR